MAHHAAERPAHAPPEKPIDAEQNDPGKHPDQNLAHAVGLSRPGFDLDIVLFQQRQQIGIAESGNAGLDPRNRLLAGSNRGSAAQLARRFIGAEDDADDLPVDGHLLELTIGNADFRRSGRRHPEQQRQQQDAADDQVKAPGWRSVCRTICHDSTVSHASGKMRSLCQPSAAAPLSQINRRQDEKPTGSACHHHRSAVQRVCADPAKERSASSASNRSANESE